MPENLEGIFVERNLFKAKRLMCGCCHPPNQDNQSFFNDLGNKTVEIHILFYQTMQTILLYD